MGKHGKNLKQRKITTKEKWEQLTFHFHILVDNGINQSKQMINIKKGILDRCYKKVTGRGVV